MQAEAEKYLKDVAQTKNVTDKRGKLIQRAVRYLTYKERKNREDEKTTIDGWLSQPAWVLKDMPAGIRGEHTRRRNALEEQLETYSAPTDISGETKDVLHKRMKDLEDQIKTGMPTAEVMRRNPPGAVDMHMKWEKANKPRIIEWKNIKRMLEPTNDEKDYTNVEMLRSSGMSPETAASFMMGAQIPGNFGMTPLAKANWPAGMPEHGTVDTPMKQAARNEVIVAMVEDKVIKPGEIEEMRAALKQLQESNAELKAALEAKKDHSAEIKAKRILAMAKARAARKSKKEVAAAIGG
jgi:hypothetical protein